MTGTAATQKVPANTHNRCFIRHSPRHGPGSVTAGARERDRRNFAMQEGSPEEPTGGHDRGDAAHGQCRQLRFRAQVSRTPDRGYPTGIRRGQIQRWRAILPSAATRQDRRGFNTILGKLPPNMAPRTK